MAQNEAPVSIKSDVRMFSRWGPVTIGSVGPDRVSRRAPENPGLLWKKTRPSILDDGLRQVDHRRVNPADKKQSRAARLFDGIRYGRPKVPIRTDHLPALNQYPFIAVIAGRFWGFPVESSDLCVHCLASASGVILPERETGGQRFPYATLNGRICLERSAGA